MNLSQIRQKIKDKGIKRSWIAKQINCTPQAITLWLNEHKPIPDERLKQISDLLT